MDSVKRMLPWNDDIRKEERQKGKRLIERAPCARTAYDGESITQEGRMKASKRKPRNVSRRIRRLYVCPGCGMVNNPMKLNESERKEWIISGLCHECQVDVFTGP